MFRNAILCFILLLPAAIAYSEVDVDSFNFNNIQSHLPADFSNVNLTLDDAKSILRDKCTAVAGEEKANEAFEKVEYAPIELMDCINTIINFTVIQNEIDEASPRGELDIVFNKYCKKRPLALKCVEEFNSKITSCLDKEEQSNQEAVMRIVQNLLSFVCHKGGDQIALFIAEKGPECLDNKKDDIQQCINQTFSGYLSKNQSLPRFIIGPKQCQSMEKLELCVVEKLESCEEITPANIVESMFRFIKNETICRRNDTLISKKYVGSSSNLTLQAYTSPNIICGITVLLTYYLKRLHV